MTPNTGGIFFKAVGISFLREDIATAKLFIVLFIYIIHAGSFVVFIAYTGDALPTSALASQRKELLSTLLISHSYCQNFL